MRFDAPEYVQTWVARGEFPQIHDKITALLREEVGPEDGTVLDLCSSTGLLARRLADCGYQVVAVQESGRPLSLGMSVGVYDGIAGAPLRIAPDTVRQFLLWAGRHEVRTVVARRCFPELWDALGADGFAVMVRELAAIGVRRIVLEGRVASGRSVHPLATLEREVAACKPVWRAEVARGALAVLIPETT